MGDDLRDRYDVVVVGGGAAGLSGALMLSRARRSVLVIDAGQPRNAPASGVHGFLTRDGITPADLVQIGRREVRGYGGEIITGRVGMAATDGHGGFTVGLEDGRLVRARRLLVTTGLVDELPDVPGLRERWGRDVLHCPYCHGWEVRDQAIGVLASGPMAAQKALLFRQWSDDVTLLLHDQPPPPAPELERLAARGIPMVDGLVERLEVAGDRLTGVRLRGGQAVSLQALAVAPRFVANSAVLAGLGLLATPHPSGVGEAIAADPTGRTEVPGVWVAGNVTDLMAQVLGAAAAGAAAAAAINVDLLEEDVQRAVADARSAAPTMAASTA
jgi:thioredoxin reductase